MLCQVLLYQVVYFHLEIIRILQQLGGLGERFRNDRIKDGIRSGYTVGTSDRTEFKFVSREGKR